MDKRTARTHIEAKQERTRKVAKAQNSDFNILIVAQSGRLSYEAVLFAASLRHFDPDFSGRLIVAEPQPGSAWGETDPRISDENVVDVLGRLKAEILPFTNHVFGAKYPHGNKIEALSLLPEGEPFVFFDSDTLVTGPLSTIPFDFDRPSASQRVEGTWPDPALYGVGYAEIWKSLYDRFDLDFESSLDLQFDANYWRRYLYFNAGWFYHRCPKEFGAKFLEYARSIWNGPPIELASQKLTPWLDQIALPLVIHSLGGGRDVLPVGLLDGSRSCHYRNIGLLYATAEDRVIDALGEVAAPNWVKKVLKAHMPFKRIHFQNKGERIRALFDRDHMPTKEQVIRQRIKREGLWLV